MKLGSLEIEGIAALAPMAGVADRAFRELCMDFGSCYSFGFPCFKLVESFL